MNVRWAPLGPACVLDAGLGESGGKGTVSGRITALAIDPGDPDNTVYAGTALGGVWKTGDAGLTWTPLTDRESCLSIGAITIVGTRVIVGTGEFNASGGSQGPGIGLLISTGGLTWQKVPNDDTFVGAKISQILVDPVDPKHWFVAGSLGLSETPDEGQTWQQLGGTLFQGQLVSDAVMDTSDAANPILYVAVQGLGIFRRKGTGAFEKMPGLPDTTSDNILRIALSLAPSKPTTVYAAFTRFDGSLSGVYASDGADADVANVRWELRGTLPVTVEQGDYNLVIATAPDNPQTVFLGEERLWRSTNGGRKWELLSDPKSGSQGVHADQHAIAFHPHAPSTMWLGNDGGVWRSTDGGSTWAHRNRGLQALQFYSIAQHPKNETVLLGGTQDNGAVRFEGSGAWPYSGGGDAFDTAISPNVTRFWYFSYVWQRSTGAFEPVWRSRSAGTPDSWSALNHGLDPTDFPGGKTATKLAMDPATPANLYVGTNKLYRSIDGGDTWTRIKTGSGATLASFSTGGLVSSRITAIGIAPNVLYVGTADGQFYVLKQSGGAWTAEQRFGLGKGFIGDIAVHPSNPDKIYVGIGSAHDGGAATFVGRLFRSDNGGQVWNNLTPNFVPHTNPINFVDVDPTTNPVNTIAIDPSNPTHVYVGCDVGVFVSTNEGDTWDWWNDNLPNVVVSDLLIHDDARLIRAATLGRGVWERPLGTGTATSVDIYLRDSAIDLGRRATPSSGPDPLDPSEPPRQANWFDGVDLKVDTTSLFGNFATPASTADYTPGGALDCIGFHSLSHSNPRKGANARLYLRVNNRGPLTASNVKARLFWASKSGGAFPDLPTDFWTAFPDTDPSDVSTWHPLAGAATVPEIRPGEPAIVTIPWSPTDLGDTIGILAAITVPEDPVNETGRVIASIVPGNKHLLLKEMKVGSSDLATALKIIGIIVLLGLAAYGGYKLYEKLKG